MFLNFQPSHICKHAPNLYMQLMTTEMRMNCHAQKFLYLHPPPRDPWQNNQTPHFHASREMGRNFWVLATNALFLQFMPVARQVGGRKGGRDFEWANTT